MSDLNSLILQGIITADPVIGDKKCDFSIDSIRFIKSDGTRHEETITVRVKIADQLAEECRDRLVKWHFLSWRAPGN
jgi:single-stranded DNA-binding protein